MQITTQEKAGGKHIPSTFPQIQEREVTLKWEVSPGMLVILHNKFHLSKNKNR